jgi:hypothetical protein
MDTQNTAADDNKGHSTGLTAMVKGGARVPRPTARDTYTCKGFAVPFQIVFDHYRFLRVIDGSLFVRTERVCERQS